MSTIPGYTALGGTGYSEGTTESSSFFATPIREDRRGLFVSPDGRPSLIHVPQLVRGELGNGLVSPGGPPVIFGTGLGSSSSNLFPGGPQPLLGSLGTYAPLGNAGDLGGGLGGTPFRSEAYLNGLSDVANGIGPGNGFLGDGQQLQQSPLLTRPMLSFRQDGIAETVRSGLNPFSPNFRYNNETRPGEEGPIGNTPGPVISEVKSEKEVGVRAPEAITIDDYNALRDKFERAKELLKHEREELSWMRDSATELLNKFSSSQDDVVRLNAEIQKRAEENKEREQNIKDLNNALNGEKMKFHTASESVERINSQLNESRRQYDDLMKRGQGDVIERVKQSASDQYNLMVNRYEETLSQMRDSLRDKCSQLTEEVVNLRRDKEATEREALSFKVAAHQQISEKDQVIASLSSKGEPPKRVETEFFNVGSDEYQSCGHRPTESGSSRTIAENRGSGEGGISQPPNVQSTEEHRSAENELRNRMKRALGQNVDPALNVTLPRGSPEHINASANQHSGAGPQSAQPVQATSFAGGGVLIGGEGILQITRPSISFHDEDRDFVRGSAGGNTTGGSGAGGHGGGGGTFNFNGDGSGGDGPNNSGGGENGGTGGGGGGGGPSPPGPPDGTVHIAQDAAREGFNRRPPKVNVAALEKGITSLPTPGDIDIWVMNRSTAIGNAYPEDPATAERLYYNISKLSTLAEVDAIARGHTELEVALNSSLRQLIEKTGDAALKREISKLTEDTFKPNPPRVRIRAEHIWFTIIDRCRSNDVGEVFYDQQVLFNTQPKARNGIEKIHWMELESWLDEIDQVSGRMRRPVTDNDTLYTIFVKKAQVEKMEILALQMHEHKKIPPDERTWQDIRDRIARICRDKRMERNNAIKQSGKNVAMNARVPGVPAEYMILDTGLGSDGMIIDSNTPITPRDANSNNVFDAAPGAKRTSRGRSISRGSAFKRGRSWDSPGGLKHSPSGYRYTRKGSRLAPGGQRQKPRGRSTRGRYKYSNSPLRSSRGRAARQRRSSMAATRSPSTGAHRGRNAAPALERPGMPVINGVQVPDGVCAYAFRGERCPFKNDAKKYPQGCKFSHDPAKFKTTAPPAGPAVSENEPTTAEIYQERLANSPRGASGGGDTEEY